MLPGQASVRPSTFHLTFDEVAVAEMLIAGGLWRRRTRIITERFVPRSRQIGILCELARHA